MVRRILWVFGRRTEVGGKVLFSSQHIKGTYDQHGITTNISLGIFNTVVILSPTLFHIVPFGRKALQPRSPCFSGEFRFNFPKTRYLHKLFEIYLPKRGLICFCLVLVGFLLFFVVFIQFFKLYSIYSYMNYIQGVVQ